MQKINMLMLAAGLAGGILWDVLVMVAQALWLGV